MKIIAIIIPILLIALVVFATTKKINVYETFTAGAKKAFKLIFDIFPYICAILIIVNLLEESGLITRLIDVLSPVLSFLGVPSEIMPLIILKPFSGSGSLALLDKIYTDYGVDSFISRCASVVFGSSETTFYIAGVYFSLCKTKKLAKPIAISLFCTFLSSIFACFLCNIM